MSHARPQPHCGGAQPVGTRPNPVGFSAHASTMARDVPLPERLTVFARAGFDAFEIWWPFSTAAPSRRDVDKFLSLVAAYPLRLSGMNLYEGGSSSGARGLACIPEAAAALDSSIDVAAIVANETGCGTFNLLYGNVSADIDRDAADAAALTSFRKAVAVLRGPNTRIVLEHLSVGNNPNYPIRTPQQALDLLDGLDPDTRLHTSVLLDGYHIAADALDGESAAARLMASAEYAATAGHVQFADNPGRGAPGTGALPIGHFLRGVRAAGYTGSIGCEFVCTASTVSSVARSLTTLIDT
ncbi:TIM barrel protein [Rhodococcus sp. NPDC079359]|uniref:TIM barrel protein n=1 Tax=Rhodococcus sp. NPDC079359 TaxID=3154961 RepID=UPI00345018EE